MRLTTRGILFDMDGTLVNSNAVVESIWRDFSARYGLDPQLVIAHAHGRMTSETVAEFAPRDLDQAAEVARLESAELNDLSGIVGVPGAADFVKKLPPESIAIVTSATIGLMRLRMDAAGVTIPELLVCAGDCDRGKPAPDVYLRGAELLGLAPEDVLVFEDSAAGITSGLAAGMRTIVVGDFAGPQTEGLPRLHSYEEITVTLTDGPTIHLDL